MLRALQLMGRPPGKPEYPFTVPAIAALRTLNFAPSRITCFCGENGSGKSTLLEALAAHIGFGREGGNRNMRFESSESVAAVEPLVRALRLSFGRRSGEGFYFRAESLYDVATSMDEYDEDADKSFDPGGRHRDAYGGKSLHDRSHGETFFTVLHHKFRRSGLFLLDEPEAALSAERQLALLALIHSTLRDHGDAQFILSTHSPILLGYPGAQILSFDDGHIHPIAYEETGAYQVTRRFLNHPAPMLEELFRPLGPDEEEAPELPF